MKSLFRSKYTASSKAATAIPSHAIRYLPSITHVCCKRNRSKDTPVMKLSGVIFRSLIATAKIKQAIGNQIHLDWATIIDIHGTSRMYAGQAGPKKKNTE